MFSLMLITLRATRHSAIICIAFLHDDLKIVVDILDGVGVERGRATLVLLKAGSSTNLSLLHQYVSTDSSRYFTPYIIITFSKVSCSVSLQLFVIVYGAMAFNGVLEGHRLLDV